MCLVSAVSQGAGNIPFPQWNQEGWQILQEIKALSEKFDKVMNQPDCIDPKKDQLLKDIYEYLEKHGKI